MTGFGQATVTQYESTLWWIFKGRRVWVDLSPYEHSLLFGFDSIPTAIA
jgi:hypothetical protein